MGTQQQDLFIQLVTENENLVHKICNIYGSNHEEREDLKQEIIYELWKSFGSFRGEARIQTWIYRVALNTALYFQKRKPPPGLDPARVQVGNDPDTSNMEDKLRPLYKAIHTLHYIDRAIVLLYLEKKTYKQIGDIMGMTEKNISVRLVRIKDQLRQIMTNRTEL